VHVLNLALRVRFYYKINKLELLSVRSGADLQYIRDLDTSIDFVAMAI